MAIPTEFDYANEDDFNQRYVIPLIHKLGYSVVANYHGSTEFGKDLIFAEIDRFGHVCFHAVQTKGELPGDTHKSKVVLPSLTSHTLCLSPRPSTSAVCGCPQVLFRFAQG